MSKRITESTERWCCAPQDLIVCPDSKPVVPVANPYWRRYGYDKLMCKHCGQIHVHYDFTDAAGSSDWGYRPIEDSK